MSGSSTTGGSTKPISEWTDFTLPDDQCSRLKISNPTAILPNGLSSSSNFLKEEELTQVLQVVDQNASKWYWEGFQDRKRVQRYNNPIEYQEWTWLVDRIMEELNGTQDEMEQNGNVVGVREGVHVVQKGVYPKPQELIIEERMVQYIKKMDHFVTTFECSPNSTESTNPCDTSYVAQLTLLNPCLQSINKPRERNDQTWHIESKNHFTDFLMEPNSLIIKTGESFWNWRSGIQPIQSVEQNELVVGGDTMEDRILTIQIRYIQEDNETPPCKNVLNSKLECDNTDKLSSLSLLQQESLNSMSLPELLTIIVTTSPIRSNPSTEVLEQTFSTFHFAGSEFAYACPKLIICDGCRILEKNDEEQEEDDKKQKTNKITRKHANVKQALRNGIATNDQAQRYDEFKVALKRLCQDADLDESQSSPFQNTR